MSAGQADVGRGHQGTQGFALLTWVLTPGAGQELALSPGLVLPLAGRVTLGSHFPSLGPSPVPRGSSTRRGYEVWWQPCASEESLALLGRVGGRQGTQLGPPADGKLLGPTLHQ